jgi:catechol 2,3-dioxygenase-like lactoylglutathione lyase family enzyme
MAVKHLDHLNMTVASLAESADWYGRVFGFERVEGGVYDGVPWAILRSGEALLCLYEHPDYRVPRDGERLHGLNHFGLRIQDRAAWEETVRREGVEVLYGGEVRWPHSRAWYVVDPTGYEIEVACWDQDRVAFERPRPA